MHSGTPAKRDAINTTQFYSPVDRGWDFRFWIPVAALLTLSRLAHLNVLWTDEDYHLAAGVQLWHGKMLYRDLWYDKPPLNAIVLSLAGWTSDGKNQWPLRLLGIAIAILCCWIAYRFGQHLLPGAAAGSAAGRRMGPLAAALMAFFQIFYFPHATIPLEPDTLMLAPHLAAGYFAWRKRALLAGLCAGCALLVNPKGLFVLAAAAVLLLPEWRRWGTLLTGFALPTLIFAAWLGAEGALGGYFSQVWRWGMLYANTPPSDLSIGVAFSRLLNWTGFHLLLVLGSVWGFLSLSRASRSADAPAGAAGMGARWRLTGWAAISLAAGGLGFRFSPHYLNQMIPPLVMFSSLGFAYLLGWDRTRPVAAAGTDPTPTSFRGALRSAPMAHRVSLGLAAVIAIVSIVRFTPGYVELAWDDLVGRDHELSAVHMDQDARRAMQMVRSIAKPGDTIFVWGYRPNVVAYSRLAVASRYWDSQPLTGVPADRHFANADSLDAEWAARNRTEMVQTKPDIFIDGLSPYNPALNITSFPETAEWFKNYCLVGDTGKGLRVYRRCEGGQP